MTYKRKKKSGASSELQNPEDNKKILEIRDALKGKKRPLRKVLSELNIAGVSTFPKKDKSLREMG